MSIIQPGERLASKVTQEHIVPEVYQLFHENTKLNAYKLKLLQFNLAKHVRDKDFKVASVNSGKCYPTVERINLDVDDQIEMKLIDAIVSRRSKRNFLNTMIPFSTLSTIIKYSVGITGQTKVENSMLDVRAYPSAGALYPIEVYVVANNVEYLKKGVYHYNVAENCLEYILNLSENDLTNKFNIRDQSIDCAPITILLTAMFHRTIYKYGNRGYRFILTESGHLLQNIALLSTSYGMGTCDIGGYEDDEINEMLGIDGMTESVIGEMALGLCGDNGNEMPGIYGKGDEDGGFSKS